MHSRYAAALLLLQPTVFIVAVTSHLKKTSLLLVNEATAIVQG